MTGPAPQPGARLIAGVDEVGRGPLAGPVVAAAVILLRPLEGLADSKLLDAPTRERLALRLREVALIGVAAASVTEIDRINILHASMLAMRRAVLRLGCLPDLALIDGNRAPDLPCPSDTIVAGDRDIPAIGAASIVAKVARDRLMHRLAERYPGYGWESNVGYPTAVHREAVRRLGVTCHHRRSFATVQAVLFPEPS
jgi:ribonuclease HII